MLALWFRFPLNSLANSSHRTAPSSNSQTLPDITVPLPLTLTMLGVNKFTWRNESRAPLLTGEASMAGGRCVVAAGEEEVITTHVQEARAEATMERMVAGVAILRGLEETSLQEVAVSNRPPESWFLGYKMLFDTPLKLHDIKRRRHHNPSIWRS